MVTLRRFASGLAVAMVATVGCGGPDNIGRVSGRVTLDGQPLPGALVQFSPVNPGVPSNGLTDSNGNYELSYTRELEGAEIGEHLVKVSTYRLGDLDANPPVAESPEKVPAKYAAGERREVKAGSNTIDIELRN